MPKQVIKSDKLIDGSADASGRPLSGVMCVDGRSTAADAVTDFIIAPHPQKSCIYWGRRNDENRVSLFFGFIQK